MRVARVAAARAPVSGNARLEAATLPGPDDVAAAVRRLLDARTDER